jgi:type I restriction enzyme S subunit
MYVLYAMRATVGDLAARATGSTFSAVTGDQVRDHPIRLAPLAEQRRIVAAIEEHFSRLDASGESLRAAERRLSSLRIGVLQAAVESEGHSRKIGDIASVISGPAFQSKFFLKDGSGVRLLRGDNIEPGRLRWTRTRTWPADRLEGHEHLFLAEGDLILGMDRPVISTGLKLARVEKGDVPALLVQRVARIRACSDVDGEFLHFALQLPRFVPHVLADQTGTQLPHITLEGIRSYEVLVPPFEVQRRIVAEIEHQLLLTDSLRDAVEYARKRSAALRRAILDRAFRGVLVPQDPNDEPASVLLERIRIERAGAPKPVGRKRILA